MNESVTAQYGPIFLEAGAKGEYNTLRAVRHRVRHIRTLCQEIIFMETVILLYLSTFAVSLIVTLCFLLPAVNVKIKSALIIISILALVMAAFYIGAVAGWYHAGGLIAVYVLVSRIIAKIWDARRKG